MSLKNKVGKLDNVSRLRTINKPPSSSQGKNGDMLLGNVAGRSVLYIKHHNKWVATSLSDSNKDKPKQSPLLKMHDTGWFDVNTSVDDTKLYSSDNTTMGSGKYSIRHRLASPFVRTEVFCRFAAPEHSQMKDYIVNLSSHVSHSGSNASKYGYFIRMLDNNHLDLHIFPDGLSVLHSEVFQDENGNTGTMLTSNDITDPANSTKEYPAIEMRLFIYPIRSILSIPKVNNEAVNLKNDHMHKGSKMDQGSVTRGTGSAKREGTNEDEFYIGSNSSTGVLLKNSSGLLKVRDIGDTADAYVQSAGLKDTNGNINIKVDKVSNAVNHLKAINSITGLSTTGPILTVDGANNDTSLRLTAKGNGIVTAVRAASGDAAENATGLWVDFDRTVASSGTNAHNDIGIDLDVNSASLGTSSVKGMDIDVVGATSGTHTARGIDLTVSGADHNIGLYITAPDGVNDSHIKLVAADDAADYATINLADTGDLTIATVGSGTTDSNLTLDADGGIYLDADNGTARLTDGGSTFTPAHADDLVTKAYVDSVKHTAVWGGALPRIGASGEFYGIPTGQGMAVLRMGTGLSPDTSYSVSTTGDDLVACIWASMHDITVTGCKIWVSQGGATNTTHGVSLMRYDIDADGDLSNGVQVGSVGTLDSDDYSQARAHTLTLSGTAADLDVDFSDGQILIAFVEPRTAYNAYMAAKVILEYTEAET